MRSRHSSAYDQLAVAVGRRACPVGAGLKKPTPESVAGDDGLRAVRDAIWEEYERQLRDDKTYTLDAIVDWLRDPERGATAARSSVHRDRLALLARERAVALCAAKARAVLEAATASGEHDTLRGGRVLAGQLLFNALSELSAEALEELSPSQVLKMIETLGYLSKTHAETDLLREKVGEMQRRFDEETRKATQKTGDGKLTGEQIAEIRRAVFGEAA